jgi:hypothetical protein
MFISRQPPENYARSSAMEDTVGLRAVQQAVAAETSLGA